MLVRSPSGLHYPITITDLKQKTDDEVKLSMPLFTYTYETIVTERDRYGEEERIKRKFPARFDCSVDGHIREWFIKKGDQIRGAGIQLCEIDEPCTHEEQFGGLCTSCGKDMTEVNYLTAQPGISRATVNMTHDNTALLVSQREARKAEEDAKARLLGVKKLSLIVDLDQTIIHTTCERTVAEWQSDPNNPNYDAVKDVKSFQLADDKMSNIASNWYYCKTRPGLKEFLESVSQMYELHVYTMATRAYAQEVAKIIDPERKYFGDRILSRDENGAQQIKSLHRLFPTNTDMVVIIDDRGDIWHYSDNLVRVRQYNFFLGAGDINASFLPKQQELITSTTPPTNSDSGEGAQPSTTDKPGPKTGIVSAEEAEVFNEIEQQLISMGGGESAEVLEKQVKEQEKVIITQQTERPLLHRQLLLDEADEKEETQNGETPDADHHKQRHGLLHDDDAELPRIEKCLRRVHKAFYDEYTKRRATPQANRVAELRGEKSPKKRALLEDSNSVPDVKMIMPRMKRAVLGGCNMVFSGIIPLGTDIQMADISRWTQSFGANVSANINQSTTHVVANPSRKTSKMKEAARRPQQIKIVTVDWLLECFSAWERVDEEPYKIQVDPEHPAVKDGEGSPFQDLGTEPILSADDEDTGIEENEDVDEEEEVLSDDFTLDMSEDKWQSIGDELAEFMDEDDSEDDDDESTRDNSDAESIQSDASNRTTESTASNQKRGIKRKRKRGKKVTGTDSASASEAEESDASTSSASGGGSRLERKKKRVLERVTSLNNVIAAADQSSGLPSPETTGPEEEQEGEKIEGVAAGDEDDEDGLEAEMLAEFEKDGSEVPEGGGE